MSPGADPGLARDGMNLLHRGMQGCSSGRQINEDLQQKAGEKGASPVGHKRWNVGGEHWDTLMD